MVAKTQNLFFQTTVGLEAGWGTLALSSAFDGDSIFWLRDHSLHIRILVQDWQKFFLANKSQNF